MNDSPSAELATLNRRAQLLSDIRQYFAHQQVIEADVPALAHHTVTDVNLDALACQWYGQPLYLQTSPEFYLKRLLSAGVGDVYSLGKAYRNDDSGRYHQPEFTMLEWYRLGFDDTDLMADVCALLAHVGVSESVHKVTYEEVFLNAIGLNPHYAETEELKDYCLANFDVALDAAPRSTWLELLFSFVVEPQLQMPTLVSNYPSCQAALAKCANDEQGTSVAKRFELYWCGIELANGYWELTDPTEQRARFAEDNQQRLASGRPIVTPDPHFLASIDAGLPECAGVALGVDRLLMCLAGKSHIAEVTPFAF